MSSRDACDGGDNSDNVDGGIVVVGDIVNDGCSDGEDSSGGTG